MLCKLHDTGVCKSKNKKLLTKDDYVESGNETLEWPN